MVCFNGRDRSGAYRLEQTRVGCLSVTVARCTWYVQSEDSLIQIAARFSTNWLQVWHFNPTLLHPDDSLVPQSLLNIGHLYQVCCSLLLPVRIRACPGVTSGRLFWRTAHEVR